MNEQQKMHLGDISADVDKADKAIPETDMLPNTTQQGVETPSYSEDASTEFIQMNMGEVDTTGMIKMDSEELNRLKYNQAKYEATSEIRSILGDMDKAIEAERERVEGLDTDEERRAAIIEAAQAAKKEAYVSEERQIIETSSSTIAGNRSDIDVDDFVPSYLSEDELHGDDGDESENISDSSDSKALTIVQSNDNDIIDDEEDAQEKLMQDIRDLAEAEEDDPECVRREDIAMTIRGKSPRITKVSRAPRGDQSFANMVAEFKKKSNRVVRVPLVNSGFFADVVGTGAQDMIMLYGSTESGATALKYEIEKMKTVIKGVVGTTPNVRPENLGSSIHYTDYQMLAYGRLCATFDKINSIGTCSECGNEFKFSRRPESFLLNADELEPHMNSIRNGTISENSLLSKDRKFEFPNSGITVVMGHPNYIDMIHIFNSMLTYSFDNKHIMSEVDERMFAQTSRFRSLIRSIMLPNGLKANTEYQKYIVLKMLDSSEFAELRHTAKEYEEQIVVPKFGVKGLICPHCKKSVSIEIDNIEALIFFHSTVFQAMSEA